MGILVSLAAGVPPCRFRDGPAVARFALDRGCVVYAHDRYQDLCPQHIVKATPIGSMTLIAVWTLDRNFGEFVQEVVVRG